MKQTVLYTLFLAASSLVLALPHSTVSTSVAEAAVTQTVEPYVGDLCTAGCPEGKPGCKAEKDGENAACWKSCQETGWTDAVCQQTGHADTFVCTCWRPREDIFGA